MITVIAHVGHWAVNLLYVAPIFAVIVFVAVQSWRDRRRG